MGTLLSLRIQERFDELTPSEQKLAMVLLDRSDDVLAFSAKELAEVSGVSPATAVRLFKNLGYVDFNEVRLQARQERNRTGPTTSVMVPSDPVAVGPTTPAAHLQVEINNLARTFESLDPATLQAAAEQLATARRLWIGGLGSDSAIARLAWTLYSQVRQSVFALPQDSETWPPELATMGPGDVLLLVASRPWPGALRPLLEFTQTARVRVIVVTDPTGQARVQRMGGLAIVCHALQVCGRHSYTSMVSMVALLHQATVERLGEPARVRAELIDGLREKFLEG